MRQSPMGREQFAHFYSITTRWADNDAYGHVNNVVYYQWFDTVVNQFLIAGGTLDVHQSDAIALVVETHCSYFSSIAFPDAVTAALRVERLGHSSVRYEVAIFRGEDTLASAQGHFIHVYVDRLSRQAVPIPASARALLSRIQVNS